MTTPGFVYFIKPVGMPGPVKIGWAKVAEDRLLTLAMFSPFPLEIVAKVPGTTVLERTLHACFADTHSHSEWFRPSDRLTAAVEALRLGTPIEQAVDLKAAAGVIRVENAPPSRERSEFLRLRRALGLAFAAANRHRNGRCPLLCAPEDVRSIMMNWSRRLRFAAWMPGVVERKRISQVISDPERYGEPIVVAFRPDPTHAADAPREVA